MASRKWPYLKLWVGMMLRALVVLTIPAVPYRFSFSPRTGWSRNSSRSHFVYSLNFSGSSISSLREPATETAFKRFEPMTAPTPVRPAMRSFETMPANRTLFSPAGPITAWYFFFSSRSCVA